MEKARNIQKVGGTAGLLLNTRKKPYLFEMPVGPEGGNGGIEIPFLMVPFDGEVELNFMLQKSASGGGGGVLGRVNIL